MRYTLLLNSSFSLAPPLPLPPPLPPPSKKRPRVDMPDGHGMMDEAALAPPLDWFYLSSNNKKKRVDDVPDGHRKVDDFVMEGYLGEGSYGVVYRARNRLTGEIVAVKTFLGEEKGTEREIECMRLCGRHPSVVELKEVVLDRDGKAIALVMEHGGRDLRGVLDIWPGDLSESEVRSLMSQLLQGVKHLHVNGIIHRDLKPSNLLLSRDGKLKICDFGLACRCSRGGRQAHTEEVVTRWYRAPELLLGAGDYTAAIDMWSVGCIMAELLTRKPLFPGDTEGDQLSKIAQVLGIPTEKTLPGLMTLPGASSLATPVKRPRNKLYSKFSKTPKLSKTGLDLLKRLLMYDSEKRLTADAALHHPWFAAGSSEQQLMYIA